MNSYYNYLLSIIGFDILIFLVLLGKSLFNNLGTAAVALADPFFGLSWFLDVLEALLEISALLFENLGYELGVLVAHSHYLRSLLDLNSLREYQFNQVGALFVVHTMISLLFRSLQYLRLLFVSW